jgi:hypothetical protein
VARHLGEQIQNTIPVGAVEAAQVTVFQTQAPGDEDQPEVEVLIEVNEEDLIPHLHTHDPVGGWRGEVIRRGNPNDLPPEGQRRMQHLVMVRDVMDLMLSFLPTVGRHRFYTALGWRYVSTRPRPAFHYVRMFRVITLRHRENTVRRRVLRYRHRIPYLHRGWDPEYRVAHLPLPRNFWTDVNVRRRNPTIFYFLGRNICRQIMGYLHVPDYYDYYVNQVREGIVWRARVHRVFTRFPNLMHTTHEYGNPGDTIQFTQYILREREQDRRRRILTEMREAWFRMELYEEERHAWWAFHRQMVESWSGYVYRTDSSMFVYMGDPGVVPGSYVRYFTEIQAQYLQALRRVRNNAPGVIEVRSIDYILWDYDPICNELLKGMLKEHDMWRTLVQKEEERDWVKLVVRTSQNQTQGVREEILQIRKRRQVAEQRRKGTYRELTREEKEEEQEEEERMRQGWEREPLEDKSDQEVEEPQEGENEEQRRARIRKGKRRQMTDYQRQRLAEAQEQYDKYANWVLSRTFPEVHALVEREPRARGEILEEELFDRQTINTIIDTTWREMGAEAYALWGGANTAWQGGADQNTSWYDPTWNDWADYEDLYDQGEESQAQEDQVAEPESTSAPQADESSSTTQRIVTNAGAIPASPPSVTSAGRTQMTQEVRER